MQTTKVSNRYAKALFSTATNNQIVDEVLKNCNTILSIFEDQNKLFEIVKNPTINKKTKMSILNKVFSNSLCKLTTDFLMLVVQKGREILLPEIIAKYILLYNANKNIIVAEVISAKSLDAELKDSIKKKISLGSRVELKEKIDESLLGGFIIKIGDLQYDSSVKKQINNVKRSFKL